jgi:hypothetical protein
VRLPNTFVEVWVLFMEMLQFIYSWVYRHLKDYLKEKMPIFSILKDRIEHMIENIDIILNIYSDTVKFKHPSTM